MSGAMIRISKSDDPNTSPSTERQIMITGNTDSVALAKSLINMSLDLHKASLERAGRSSDEEDSGEERRGRGRGREERRERERFYNEGSAEGLTGLASLLTKPDVLAAVNILGQLGGIGGSNNNTASLGQVTGGYGGRGRSYGGGSGRGGSRETDGERRDSKRSKFAPY